MVKYNHSKIEKKWHETWLKEKIYEPHFDDASRSDKPFYNLMMFPYPSAEGLHVGNMYAFTGSDIYGRLKRMQGYDVFEPIGLDGFGIHSENYALKIGKHPADQAKISEKNFYRQLEMIGNGFSWNERLETYDPEYYKWTQWIFTQMYKNGLAYRKKSAVNWCTSCLTVLADEQVIGGECERCGNKVIKKELEQWFFRITKYADKLLSGLDTIDWSEKVKIAQRNWIGKSEGATIKFQIPNPPAGRAGSKFQKDLEVFTTRPDTLFGATFMAVSVELAQKWIEEGWQADEDVKEYIKSNITPTPNEGRSAEKTGIFTGLNAINPVNKKEIPIWVADYVLSGYGSGAVMCVPAHDERDFEFAKKFNLEIIRVIEGGDLPYVDSGKLVDSGKFDGMDSEKAKWEITKLVGGEKKIQYRLRDWLISRQRYWGAPIPLVFCQNCAEKIKNSSFAKASADRQKSNLKINEEFNIGELENPGWVTVSEKDLPVKLPYIKEFRPTGTNQSPLASDEKFYKTKCPKCGGIAKRETDVSDTFLDSAWYYIGYLFLKNPKFKIPNHKQILNSKFQIPKEIIENWLPVDMYIGGAEHSVLHLLYVRFLSMALHDIGLLNFPARGGSDLVRSEPFKKFRAHGLLIKDGSKMSKSKGNVINPDDYIEKYGADALRMYLMFLGPFDQGGDFRDEGIRGITRFLERVWKLSTKFQIINNKQIQNSNIQKSLHKTIKKVTEDIENLNYNTAVSALMILLNDFESNQDSIGKKEVEIFLRLLAPFAPHMTEEIWRNVLKNKKSIHISEFPKYDPELIKESEVDIVVQINGKMRSVIKVAVGLDQKEVENLAKKDENVSKNITSEVKKVIFVKDKLINFVV
jgi:leucyl-tRNA synthetase